MKRISYVLLTLVMSLVSLTAQAEWYNEFTFVVGNNVCGPITVRYAGRSYTVRSSLTINTTGSTSTPSATDCRGKSLKYEVKSSTHNSGSNTYHYYTYTFYNRDNYGSSNSNGGGGYNGYNSYNNSNSSYNTGAYVGQAVGSAVFSLGGGSDGDAYPSLQLTLGLSRGYGENLRLRYTGCGFLAYGSVGKDLIFDSEFKDKILWNIGVGSYFAFGGKGNPNMDISLGLSVGQLAQWEKLSLMIDVDYTCWIGRWRRVGVFAGGSLGWGGITAVFDTDDETIGGFAWNLEVGIVIRIADF